MQQPAAQVQIVCIICLLLVIFYCCLQKANDIGVEIDCLAQICFEPAAFGTTGALSGFCNSSIINLMPAAATA